MSPSRDQANSTVGITQVVLPFVLVYFSFSVSAQTSQYPILSKVDSVEVWFDRIVGTESAAIANGPEYRVAFKGLRSHPFFLHSESDRTFLRYDNDLYRNIDLLYDSFKDALVYKCITTNHVQFIELNNTLVQNFDLYDHHFKKYKEGIDAGIGVYFEVLFEGNGFAVLAKRRKLERMDGTLSEYVEEDVYYILNDGDWIRIVGNGSFQKTLPKEQRKELAAFIKSNQINVRKRKDDELKKLGAFCFSLKEKR